MKLFIPKDDPKREEIRKNILKQMAEGYTIKEVATKLQVANRYVDNELENMRMDHNCANTMQLVVKAVRAKVI